MMEIETVETTETDSLALFREQVRNEVKPSMSEAAAQKLRAINETDRLDKIANGRFCTALKSVIVNDENLAKLLTRCHTSAPLTLLERRVHKLNWFISAGFELGREIDSVHLINFFSELTSDETAMTDSQFQNEWNGKDAVKIKQSRLDRGIIASDVPVYRPCKSGKKCLRFEKRKAAPAAGKGEYCGPACSASDRARQKRALAGMPTDTIQ